MNLCTFIKDKFCLLFSHLLFFLVKFLLRRGLSRSSLDHHPLPEEADDNQTPQHYLHDLQEALSTHNRYLRMSAVFIFAQGRPDQCCLHRQRPELMLSAACGCCSSTLSCEALTLSVPSV